MKYVQTCFFILMMFAGTALFAVVPPANAQDCSTAAPNYHASPSLETAATYINCLETAGSRVGPVGQEPPAILRNTVADAMQCPLVPKGPSPPGTPVPSNPSNDIVDQLRMLKVANGLDDATWIAIMSAATNSAGAMTIVVDQSKFPQLTALKPFVVTDQNLGVKGAANQYWFTGAGYDSVLAQLGETANE